MVVFVPLSKLVRTVEDMESVKDHVDSDRSCCIILGNPREHVAVYYGQNHWGEMLCTYLKEQVDTGSPACTPEEVETYHAVIEAITRSLNLRSRDMTMREVTEQYRQRVSDHLSEIMNRMQLTDQS